MPGPSSRRTPRPQASQITRGSGSGGSGGSDSGGGSGPDHRGYTVDGGTPYVVGCSNCRNAAGTPLPTATTPAGVHRYHHRPRQAHRSRDRLGLQQQQQRPQQQQQQQQQRHHGRRRNSSSRHFPGVDITSTSFIDVGGSSGGGGGRHSSNASNSGSSSSSTTYRAAPSVSIVTTSSSPSPRGGGGGPSSRETSPNSRTAAPMSRRPVPACFQGNASVAPPTVASPADVITAATTPAAASPGRPPGGPAPAAGHPTGRAPRTAAAPEAKGVAAVRRGVAEDVDLLTRTSWVDAATAYTQIKRGKATGNAWSLWLRWKLQRHLYNLGCFTQKHCGKALFVGLLLLSLCCVGLKTATMETDVERLWVEEGGRLDHELAYTKKILGEGSGSTNEIVIQTPRPGSTNVLSPESLLLHYQSLRTATKVTVVVDNEQWSLSDLCYKTHFPSMDEDSNFIDSIMMNIIPCMIITPLDCFWEASKLLGPEPGVHVPYSSETLKWYNLDPRDMLRNMAAQSFHFNFQVIEEIMDRAGIGSGYQEKPCLNPYDPMCPDTAPNKHSKQAPNVGAELTGGCAGFATRYMHWEEELIIGGFHKNRTGYITRAEALQSLIMLSGEKELYEFYRDTSKVLRLDWSQEKAKQVLEAWQRKFTQDVTKVAVSAASGGSYSFNGSTGDNVYPFSSASLLDLLNDFSQISTVRVAMGYVLMLVYACVSMLRWTDPVQSQSGVGIAGVLLVSLSVAAGLGMCSVLGIKFNASTTQIIPFLALGLGVDDMFLIAHTFSENANKPSIQYMDQTGECLKRVGISVLLTSLSNACAFFIAAIIPIPALRAFCLQAAILVLFNMSTIMLVFPAVVSLDLIRREEQKVDVLCCFTGSSATRGLAYHPQAGHQRELSPPPDYYESTTAPPAYSNDGAVNDMVLHQTITQTESDGRHPTTVLAPPEYDGHNFRHVPSNAVCPATSLPPSTTSSQQCLTPEEENPSCRDRCAQAQRECCSFPLTRFARNVYGPLMQKTPAKIFVVLGFIVVVVLGVIGTVRVEDGLDITDVVPRGTNEYNFLAAQSKYFGFYNFYAVTQKDFDYAHEQQLVHDYHAAFRRVDKIIKKEDGSLPDSWLQLMRDWLLDIQEAFDRDYRLKSVTQDGWCANATEDGILGYKLIVQTGDLDDPIDKDRVAYGRLVDNEGIIYPPAFYNYLSAWSSNDALAYAASQADFHPSPKEWYHVVYSRRAPCYKPDDSEITVSKAQPLVFAQLAFYLHDMGDTVQVTDTVKQIREICDTYAEHGLPNYPRGIPFTFWEQYISLRFYLMLALICVLVGIFLVLTLVLLNPWAAIVVVVVLAMMVVELFGFMGLIGIKLSAVPAVILIVSVGVGVEFTVHICLGYLTAIGSRNKRMRVALEHMFAPVVHGAMTTLLGVVMLAAAEFDFIVKYFFVVMTVLVAIGLLNGLIFLPVLLSVIGPAAEVVPADKSDYLPPPTPEPSPPPARRSSRSHHGSRSGGRRQPFPRMPSDISLTTITEEPSTQYSSRESQSIAVRVQPEVVVQTTTMPEGGTTNIININTGSCSHSAPRGAHNSSPPSSDSSSPPAKRRHVTTVKATARVKVEVHTPSSVDTDVDYKWRKRKCQDVEARQTRDEAEDVVEEEEEEDYEEETEDGESGSSFYSDTESSGKS